jgi:hypothetical protein
MREKFGVGLLRIWISGGSDVSAIRSRSTNIGRLDAIFKQNIRVLRVDFLVIPL